MAVLVTAIQFQSPQMYRLLASAGHIHNVRRMWTAQWMPATSAGMTEIAVMAGRPTGSALPLRQALEGGEAVGDLVEGLLVAGVDGHLRRAEQGRVVERADLDDDG